GVWQFALPLPPAFDLSPSPVAFGNQLIKTSSNRTVVLTNNSGATINLGSITLGTPTGTDFAITSNNCSATLANLAICQVQVSFSPQNPGQQSNTLIVPDNATGGPHSVNLTGTGSDFSVAVGASGSSVTVNSGQPATYNLNATSISGFNGTVTFACTSGVPTAASCSFSPSAAVTVSSSTAVTLTISTTAHSSSQPAPTLGFIG